MKHRDDGKRTQSLVPVSSADPVPRTAERPANADCRKGLRVEMQHAASVKLGNVSYTVELRDVSRTGAQISIRRGLMPSVGQLVELQFLNNTLVEASVVWTNETDAGLHFAAVLPDGFDALHYDDLGSEYFRAVLRLQIGGS